MIEALRAAAVALVNAAPEPVVRQLILRLLAEDTESMPAPASRTLPPASPRSSAPRPAPTKALNGTHLLAPADQEWESLRQAAKDLRRQRGLSYEQLGNEIGYTERTITAALQARKPPHPGTRARITAWVAAASAADCTPAPEEAAPPFRRNGNGADHAAGAIAAGS